MNGQVTRLLLLAHVGSTWFMLGVIWLVQVVHYPLFAMVGSESFSEYEHSHRAMIFFVVAPPMLIEGATAVLLFWYRPVAVPTWSVWVGVTLVFITWLSTAMIQVPCHDLLSRGFDASVHDRLVWTNWLRTATWSLRGVLVMWMTSSCLRQCEIVTATRPSVLLGATSLYRCH